jgi:MFS family permease
VSVSLNGRMLPTWIVAIAVICFLQTLSSTLTRLVPVASPAFMADFGWHESWIGYLSAAIVVGALFVLTAGIGLFHRMGGVRALQASLLVGAASLVLVTVPSIALALLASVLIGLSNGAANPAGSEVLQRFTPAAHRNFVFSVKQAGVPLGGVIAGLAIPPLVEMVGLRMALVAAGAALAGATALTWPVRARIDAPRDAMAAPRLVSFRWTDVAVPLRSLSRAPGLWNLSSVGCLLAIPQACWVTFATTYVVVALGHSLSVAGLVFAVMQATSVVGRIVMGWIADHVASSTATLALASLASALSTMTFAFASPDWPVWALLSIAAAGGISVSGWNGVQIAEVARRSPPSLIGETAAGSVILVYASNMLGPVGFAAFVAATGRFDYAFVLSGAFSLICLPLLYRIDREKDSRA